MNLNNCLEVAACVARVIDNRWCCVRIGREMQIQWRARIISARGGKSWVAAKAKFTLEYLEFIAGAEEAVQQRAILNMAAAIEADLQSRYPSWKARNEAECDQ